MKVALDTNILAYAEGIDGEDRRRAALGIVQRLAREDLVVPVQVLGELFRVLTRKAGRPRSEALARLMGWGDPVSVHPASMGTMLTAADLSIAHQVYIWDAVILAAASEAGCRLLLSEDLQHGFTWGGVTVATLPRARTASSPGRGDESRLKPAFRTNGWGKSPGCARSIGAWTDIEGTENAGGRRTRIR